jgi:hypothetical protein
MPPVIVDQPWPPDTGEDLRHPNGQLVVCPTLGRPLRASHDQIIVWATLTSGPSVVPAPTDPLFPVVLDTGFNDSFLMQRHQAEVWLSPTLVLGAGYTGYALQVGREQIPGLTLALWLFPNVPGTRAPDVSGSPLWVALPIGVPLTPLGSGGTKEKPLLGLRAIRFNKLSLHIDGQRGCVSLDAP